MFVLQFFNQDTRLTLVFVKILIAYVSIRYKMRSYVDFRQFLLLTHFLLIMKLFFISIHITITRIFSLCAMELFFDLDGRILDKGILKTKIPQASVYFAILISLHFLGPSRPRNLDMRSVDIGISSLFCKTGSIVKNAVSKLNVGLLP